MTDAKLLWSIWQALLAPFACAFSRRGHRHFVEWITALAINVEEHTITQSVLTLERPADWKAMESFAEYGGWRTDQVTWSLILLIEAAPGRTWYGYHVSAVDDTKVHRGSPEVWGTCTFHEYTARCPNRATTVRAQLGRARGRAAQPRPTRVVPADLGPALFPQVAVADPAPGARLHRAVSHQVPTGCRADSGASPHGRRTSPEHLRRRLCSGECGPAAGGPRAGLAPDRIPHAVAPRRPDLSPATGGAPEGKRGPMPKWGKPLPPPRQGGRWAGPWHVGSAFIYGRTRKVRWKEVVCLWRVLGHDVQVKAVVAQVEGYKKRFTLVSSALELTGLQMVELFCARFRQEDGFRDLKQRLGWEECRAWTKNPIERTSQAQWVTLSLLRLAQLRLESAGEVDWWFRPPWNQNKDRPSVLDLERLMRRHRAEIQRFLSEWLGDEQKTQEDVA